MANTINQYAEEIQMLGFDAEDDDAIYHTSKFVEDVPLLDYC